MSKLTPIQEQVIALLAEGQSVTSAAGALGLHRTTIHHWKRTSQEFAHALADAKEDAADHRRFLHQQHAPDAIAALASLMNNPDTPPSIRCKAAIYLLSIACGQPARPVRLTRQNQTQFDTPTPVATVEQKPAQHNSSLFITSAEKQTPYVRTEPRTGRNEKCPCGSNRKYKQCCLNKKENLAA